MKQVLTTVALLLLSATSFCQLSEKSMRKMGQYPVIYLDSIEVDIYTVQKLKPVGISNIDILKPKTATKLLGDKGHDGAIFVTTVEFARKTYWRYFCSKSEKYSQNVSSPSADSAVQYIVDGQLLADSVAPGILFKLNENNWKAIDMIDKEDGRFLIDNVYPKRYLVVITTKRPKEFSRRIKSKS